ncbi:MAG: glycosyltransferase, partial [Spirulinaceae cyanobacterium]
MANFSVKKLAILINPQGSSGVPGGICVVVSKLLQGLAAQNFDLDLVVHSHEAIKLFPDLPQQVRVINLNTPFQVRFKSAIKIIPPLLKYLRAEKPDVLICHLTLVNYLTVIARLLARVPTYLVLVEHFPFLELQKNQAKLNPLKAPLTILQRWLYLQADAIVAVSEGVAQSFEAGLNLNPGSVQVIYNPVVNARLRQKAQTLLQHPWFAEHQPPVILAVGRLLPPKDFDTLIQAFAQLRKKRPLRLLILGEGNLRSGLE